MGVDADVAKGDEEMGPTRWCQSARKGKEGRRHLHGFASNYDS